MGHSDGYMTFPWGLNITLQSVETAKDTQSNKVVADTLPTDVRGPTSFQTLPQKAVIVNGNMWSDRGTTWILSLPSIGAKLGILPVKVRLFVYLRRPVTHIMNARCRDRSDANLDSA